MRSGGGVLLVSSLQLLVGLLLLRIYDQVLQRTTS
jgi:hypothetical protein